MTLYRQVRLIVICWFLQLNTYLSFYNPICCIQLKNDELNRSSGGQTTLSAEEEFMIKNKISTCADWGYPFICWAFQPSLSMCH